jgi:entericidin B
MTRKLLALLGTLLLVLGLAGCNTIEGAGEDVEAAGEGIQRGADKDRPNP